MRTAYFDCFSGAAGDMILAALLDAGLAPDVLHETVARLKLPGVQLEITRVRRGALAATHVNVVIPETETHTHRHLPQILTLIQNAELPPPVAARAMRIFTRLGEAEAKVHGVPLDHVHFHEVGAADALVDIVGASAALHALGIERVICSPIPTGHGVIRCAHGELPVPGPATAELLRGVPLAECDEAAELTTPTGAAILTTVAAAYGACPPLLIGAIGYGAGTRENHTRPNVLRVLIGEAESAPLGDEQVVVLETQVDDATGQVIAHALTRLLDAGALDAYAVPILMKKGRPGQLLSVLCRPEQVATLEELLFRETTTFGVRRQECLRHVLTREHVAVTTPFGPVRMKLGRRGDEALQAWPEYEDCAAAARTHGIALRTVQDAALHAWMRRHEPGQPGGA